MKNCERSAATPARMSVERVDRQAAGIGVRLEHQRRHRAYQHGLGDAIGAVAPDVAGDLSAASRVADQGCAVQVQRFDECRQVVGVGVHVVAIPRLARTAVAATIMGDTAIAVGRQVDHLAFPGIGAERPAVAEDDGLSRAPVLVIDLRTVFGGDRVHVIVPSVADVVISMIMPNSLLIIVLGWPLFALRSCMALPNHRGGTRRGLRSR